MNNVYYGRCQTDIRPSDRGHPNEVSREYVPVGGRYRKSAGLLS